MKNTLIPHTLYIHDFYTNYEELFLSLKNEITWREDIKSRKTASFGKPYNYSGIFYSESGIPEMLQPFFEEIHYLTGFIPNNILINYYHEGSSKMGFHSDDIEVLEENTGVVILSLGSPRIMRFKEKISGDLLDLEIEPGSLLFMKDENQRQFLHSVLPSSEPNAERISVTFRRMK